MRKSVSLVVAVVACFMFVAFMADAPMDAKSNIAENVEAPDFALVDIDGNNVQLSSHRGKYVVIDFWGSWCGWCIKGFPAMKEMYQKYNDKLEVIGIACGDKDEVWRATVAKHELPWVNVRDYDRDSPNCLARVYEVQGFPTKVIIDPQGKVYKVVLGEDPAFYQTIDALMAE